MVLWPADDCSDDDSKYEGGDKQDEDEIGDTSVDTDRPSGKSQSSEIGEKMSPEDNRIDMSQCGILRQNKETQDAGRYRPHALLVASQFPKDDQSHRGQETLTSIREDGVLEKQKEILTCSAPLMPSTIMETPLPGDNQSHLSGNEYLFDSILSEETFLPGMSSIQDNSVQFCGPGKDEPARVRDTSKHLRSSSISTLHYKGNETSPILKTFRSEHNFLKTNDDATIQFPSPYSPEYVPVKFHINTMVLQAWKSAFLANGNVHAVLVSSAGYAFLTSFLSSLFAMAFKFEDDMREYCHPDEYSHVHIKDWLIGGGQALAVTIDGYKFLPLFLLLAYTGFLGELSKF